MATDKEQRTIEIILKAQDANASIKEMGAGAAVMTAQLSKMGQDDPGRARLLADLQSMNQRLATSRQEMRAVVQSEEQLRAAHQAVAAENIRVVVSGQRVAASFDDMRAAASQLERELGQLSADDPGREQLLADYRALQQRIAAVRTEMGHTTVEGGKFKQMLGLVGIAFTADAAIEGISSIGKALFSTTAKFETYAVVLTNALGSESAAQLALHDIQTMAAKTPFSVDELTASFIKFVNRGITPSMAELTKLADLAASQGKSFEQLTEAVLDAGTGEFERLKEFGIQASKNGNEVALSFKNVQKTVANTPEAINAALMSFGELKGVMGGTDAISKTLDGSVSNLGDTADMVAIQYGQGLKPVFVAIISTIGSFLGILAALPKFLVDNRGAILGLVVAVATLNATQIAATASGLAAIAMEKARAIATRATTGAQWLLNAAMTANPIGLVVAAVALLVGGFVTLYDKSEKVRAAVAGLGAGFMAFITTLKNGVVQQLSGIGELLVGIFTANPAKIKAGLAAIAGSMKTIYYDAGKNAGEAFSKGYDERLAAEKSSVFKKVDSAAEAAAAKKKAEEVAKARAAAEATARLAALKTQEADLKVRLAQSAAGGRQEMKLKQQLLAVQAKIELADAKKTKNERRVIEAEALDKMQELEATYNKKVAKQREDERNRLAKAAKDVAKAELATEQSIQDLRVGLIKNKYDREIAEINLQTDRKMALIKGSDEQQFEQWQLLEQERQEKMAAVNAERAEDEAKTAEETAAKKAEMQSTADELFLAGLQNRVALGLATEQEYQDKLYQLQQEALAMRLQQLVDAGQGETIEAKNIRGALLKGQGEYVKSEMKREEDLQKFKKSLAGEGRAMLADSLGFLVDNLNKQSTAYQVFKAIMKQMQLVEIGINLEAELAANAKWAAANPANALTAGFAGITQGALLNGLSIGRATLSAARVVAFEDGGNTNKGGKLVGLDMLAGLMSGRSGGSFAAGGPVNSPTLGLIGEAGAELVIPNWLYADPKQANLMGFLEAQIASRGGAFAAGGSTTGTSAAAATEAGAELSGGAVLEVLQQIARGQQEFRDEITTWQREQVVSLNLVETKKGLDVVTKTQTGGGLR